jgi:nicotinamidase/pyrazinamidase
VEALILVDLQHDFLPGGALPVPHGDQVLEVARRLSMRFSCVVATQDWHPSDHLSFADAHPGRRVGEVITLAGLPQVLWPRHCVQDSRGAELALLPDTRVARVFTKGAERQIDSYSGFFDNGYARATGVGDFLRLQGVDDVYILGLATDYCVQATALDARKLGFNTFVVVDGCRGVELQPGDIDRALAAMREAGVRLVTSAEILRRSGSAVDADQVLAHSRFLRLVRRGRWEFVQRRSAAGVVFVAAVTPERKLLFVEQFRIPVGARVIELPAGLVDDQPGATAESAAEAARRELWEETGYEAGSLIEVLSGPSSAGLTDEMVTMFLARDLRKTGPGGGVEQEDIRVHEVPLDGAFAWLESQRRDGRLVDLRAYAGVQCALHHR